MTKTFTDESGKQWQANQKTLGGYYIEPIPAPPQTEEEILRQLDTEVELFVGYASRAAGLQGIARAIVAACKKIGEVK